MIPHSMHKDITDAAYFALVKSVLYAGGTTDDAYSATETAVCMIVSAIAAPGKEAAMMKMMAERVSQRIAAVRIGDTETVGTA